MARRDELFVRKSVGRTFSGRSCLAFCLYFAFFFSLALAIFQVHSGAHRVILHLGNRESSPCGKGERCTIHSKPIHLREQLLHETTHYSD
ncbi:hypothetical protein BDV32DRAFT_123589 [Aspergillus pseudonomiae]|nr:hypothetical protein BDV32DRAFT_123589 [Aspergillus pseudonomiae]